MPLPRPAPDDKRTVTPSPETAPAHFSSPVTPWAEKPPLPGLDIPLPPVPSTDDLMAASDGLATMDPPPDDDAPSPDVVRAITAQLSAGNAAGALPGSTLATTGSRRVSLNPWKARERRQKLLMRKLAAAAAGVMLLSYVVIRLSVALPRRHAHVVKNPASIAKPQAARPKPVPTPVLLDVASETHKAARNSLALGSQLKDQGLIYEALDAYRTAAAELDGINDQSPLRAEAHSAAGTLLSQQDDLHGGAEEYRIALSLRPDDAVVNNNYGVVRFATATTMEEKVQALTMLRNAVAKEPVNPDIHDNLLYVLGQLGKNSEANAENDRFNRTTTSRARKALLAGGQSSEDILGQPLLKL